jgi:hypothetical protein
MTQARSSKPFLQAALNGDRAHAEAIERTLAEAGVTLEQVHHGEGIASWAVNRRAILRRHGIRTGLEDTPVLPTGAWPTATAISLPLPPPCWPGTRGSNSRARRLVAITPHLTA